MGAPVVVNQYSIPKTTRDGGVKGTRGSSPSAFVLDYMARPDAAEEVGGRLITGSAIRLGEERAGRLGRRFDESFAAGGVLLKTVISLDYDYLAAHELVAKGSRPARRKGDYKGKIDQVRLREAVARTLRDLGRRGGFGNLLAAAAVQTDTKHVHIHLALIDLDPASGKRRTNRAEAQAERRVVQDRAIPPARGTIRAAEREGIRQSLSAHLMASKPRSLARTPAIGRVLAFGAKLSKAAKRLMARRRGQTKDMPRENPPRLEAVGPVVNPAMTPTQAHLLLTLRWAHDRRLAKAQIAAGHEVASGKWPTIELTGRQDHDLRAILGDIYADSADPTTRGQIEAGQIDSRVWDLIASDTETADLARHRGYGGQLDAAALEVGDELSQTTPALETPQTLGRGGPDSPAK
jgi:hypothetical protein